MLYKTQAVGCIRYGNIRATEKGMHKREVSTVFERYVNCRRTTLYKINTNRTQIWHPQNLSSPYTNTCLR